jgi:hypothetical protein
VLDSQPKRKRWSAGGGFSSWCRHGQVTSELATAALASPSRPATGGSLQRFHQATAPACSPWSSSSRLEAERWPARSTVAFGSLVDHERIVMSWAYRQQAKRDGVSGPNCGTACGRSSSPPRRLRQMPPTSMDLERWRQPSRPSLTSLQEQQVRPPRSRLLRAVPGRQHGDRPKGHPRAGSSDSARLLAGLARTGDLQAGPRYWRQPRLGCLLASGRSLLYAWSNSQVIRSLVAAFVAERARSARVSALLRFVRCDTAPRGAI